MTAARVGAPAGLWREPFTVVDGGLSTSLEELGTRPEAVGKVWHLPPAWRGTSRAMIARAGELCGRPAAVTRLPGWALATLALFSRDLRAIREMLYQWEQPYVLDSSAITNAFGLDPTPWDEVCRATAETVLAG